ncbi:MAG: type II toxin-antitoxin system RelE/ParE family toxin [Beijerinckiaceae bacterium]
MKSCQVRFADEAIDDLGHIFATLLPVAGERVARDFVGRLEAACLSLATFPERGSLRDHVRPGLRIIGYRRQASIAFVVTDAEVLILRVFGRGQDVEAELQE